MHVCFCVVCWVSRINLVREALEERAHLLRCAPYMSSPVPIVMPMYTLWQVPYCWFGVKLYDLLAKAVTWFDTGVPNCFFVSRANAKFLFPHLKTGGLKGAVVYYDGQHNDSKMNVDIALTAAIPGYVDGMQGAAVANHLQVVDILKEQDSGKVVGVRVVDRLGSKTGSVPFEVIGKVVMNCAGPAADVIRRQADLHCEPIMTQATGTHLVLPGFYTPRGFGMIISHTSDGRVLFLLPWEVRPTTPM